MMRFKRILVATDFGPSAERAVEVALDLGTRGGAEIVLLHVWQAPAFAYSGMTYSVHDVLAPIRDEAQLALDLAIERASLRSMNVTGLLRAGRPWVEIRDAIDELHPDLVVLGTAGRRALARVLLGSVAEKIVRISPVPVLTVHASDERRDAAE